MAGRIHKRTVAINLLWELGVAGSRHVDWRGSRLLIPKFASTYCSRGDALVIVRARPDCRVALAACLELG